MSESDKRIILERLNDAERCLTIAIQELQEKLKDYTFSNNHTAYLAAALLSIHFAIDEIKDMK